MCSWFRIDPVVRAIVLMAMLLTGHVIPAVAEAPALPEIEVFVRDGCSHCQAAENFLDVLAGEQPGLHVSVVDVRRSPDALARLLDL